MRYFGLLLLFAGTLLASCNSNPSTGDVDNGKGSVVAAQKELNIKLLPLNNFKDTAGIKAYVIEGVKKYTGRDAKVEWVKGEKLPDSLIYKPRNRYRAEKILKYLNPKSNDNQLVYVALMNDDMSTTAHGVYDYGIQGQSYCPGHSCIISTYRSHGMDNFLKNIMHEYLHSRGVPHCTSGDDDCIMQDGRGIGMQKNRNHVCSSCLKKIKC